MPLSLLPLISGGFIILCIYLGWWMVHTMVRPRLRNSSASTTCSAVAESNPVVCFYNFRRKSQVRSFQHILHTLKKKNTHAHNCPRTHACTPTPTQHTHTYTHTHTHTHTHPITGSRKSTEGRNSKTSCAQNHWCAANPLLHYAHKRTHKHAHTHNTYAQYVPAHINESPMAAKQKTKNTNGKSLSLSTSDAPRIPFFIMHKSAHTNTNTDTYTHPLMHNTYRLIEEKHRGSQQQVDANGKSLALTTTDASWIPLLSNAIICTVLEAQLL